MKKSKAIIFDMDGVLVDSEPIQLKAMNQVLAKYDVQLTETQWKHAAGKRTIDTVGRVVTNYRIDQKIDEIILEKNFVYRKLIKTDVYLIEGVMEALNAFKNKNILMAVASSSVYEDILLILNQFSIKKYFKVIVSGDQVKNGKPAPDIFLKAAERLNVVPNSALVIEDTEVGVKAAKRAGMSCIAIPGKFSEHQDFSQADDVLKNMNLVLSKYFQ